MTRGSRKALVSCKPFKKSVEPNGAKDSPFASETPDLLELLFEVIPPITLFLLHDADEPFSLLLILNSLAATTTGDRVRSSSRRRSGRVGTRAREQFFEETLAGFERLGPFRRDVKHLSSHDSQNSQFELLLGERAYGRQNHHVADVAPAGRVHAADDPARLVKTVTAEEQFTVEFMPLRKLCDTKRHLMILSKQAPITLKGLELRWTVHSLLIKSAGAENGLPTRDQSCDSPSQ